MRKLLIAWFTFGLLGCSNDTKTDGVILAPTWTVDAAPLLEIGGVDSLETFVDVDGATRLPSGGVAVADGASALIKFFDAKGNLVRSVGGRGKGPGEFSDLTDMMRCGDSLFVRDIWDKNYKVFSIDGELGRQMDLPVDSTHATAVRSACNRDGYFINYAWEKVPSPLPGKSRVLRDSVPYWISAPTGELRSGLGRHAGLERWFIRSTGGGGGMTALPLGKLSVVAIGKSRAYVGTADSFHIEVYALDGTRAGGVTRSGSVQAVTAADIERYKFLDTVGRDARRNADYVATWATMEFPKSLPAYTAMLVDSDENLWVRLHPPASGEVVPWVVFSPDGKEIASVNLSSSMAVHEIGRDYVLGSEMDAATGTNRVRVFALRRTSR